MNCVLRYCYRYILILFVLTSAGLSVYTYAHVDLNLTLSNYKPYQAIQKKLTTIGYFNRPLSTILFFSLLGVLVLYYLLFIAYSERWKIPEKELFIALFFASLFLLFSYPAFAHDIFNYLFDTRILVKYQQNPWTMTPLDYSEDEWTRFMRWTHVPSVYPPGWILTTIPFFLLGFGKFTLTLFSFKLLGFLSFLGSSWLMRQLSGRQAWILWSFNPMILIESLSSVHNEIVMVFFTLLGFWLVRKRSDLIGSDLIGSDPARLVPYLAMIWGGLIKYTSFLLLPFMNRPVWAAVAAWIGALVFFYVREINPWYILLPVAISFMSKNRKLTSLSLISSLLVMYRYYPCVAIFSC